MTDGFYDLSDEEITFVPFDIETTGFKAAQGDFITNVVLHNDDQYHIWINTDGNEVDASEMRESVIQGAELENIVLYVCEDERDLLQNLGDYLDTHTDNNTILTAFNGETYKGNSDFDVPFMRTRCFRNGVRWILDGYWYTDSYEIFSEQSRFDTTVKAEPSLEDMKKTDIQQFADDMGFDIHYGNMKKAELIRALESHDGVTPDMLQSWALEKNVVQESVEADSFNRLVSSQNINKSPLQDFVDDMSVDISYNKLSKDELIREIRERGYDEEMLIEWHKETGRKIGTEEIGTLDGIHEVVIEDMLQDGDWRNNLPFDVEVFEPFDPYVDSGEAVTAYLNGDYAGVILHCFADVARTVNITRAMEEYAPKSDYKPKVL